MLAWGQTIIYAIAGRHLGPLRGFWQALTGWPAVDQADIDSSITRCKLASPARS